MGTLFDDLVGGTAAVHEVDAFEVVREERDPAEVVPVAMPTKNEPLPEGGSILPPSLASDGSILPPEEEQPWSMVGTIGPSAPSAPVPDFLKTLYRRENFPAEGFTSWYLKPGSDPSHPAFVENPTGLHFEDSRDPDALRAGLMLAHERGWVPATLSGTPEFCSRAFLAAAELGIRTTGYVPTPDDLKVLETRGLSIPTAATSIPLATPVVLAAVAENERVAAVTKLLCTMDWQYFSGSPEARQAGHDHLDRILNELEAVAATNPTEAATIWDKYAPADLYRPTYLPAAQHADSGFSKLIQAVKDALGRRPTSAPQKSGMAPK